jgi:hypothetical protein
MRPVAGAWARRKRAWPGGVLRRFLGTRTRSARDWMVQWTGVGIMTVSPWIPTGDLRHVGVHHDFASGERGQALAARTAQQRGGLQRLVHRDRDDAERPGVEPAESWRSGHAHLKPLAWRDTGHTTATPSLTNRADIVGAGRKAPACQAGQVKLPGHQDFRHRSDSCPGSGWARAGITKAAELSGSRRAAPRRHACRITQPGDSAGRARRCRRPRCSPARTLRQASRRTAGAPTQASAGRQTGAARRPARQRAWPVPVRRCR